MQSFQQKLAPLQQPLVCTRSATLPDTESIYAIMERYYSDGTLLPRPLPELCENIRDFVVAENEGKIIGCGALHLYGLHLAEIRSVAVHPDLQRRGAGRLLVKALLREAERHSVICVCLFTRTPEFFAAMGFRLASRQDLPDKIYKDCVHCPRFYACDETAMVLGRPAKANREAAEFAAPLISLRA